MGGLYHEQFEVGKTFDHEIRRTVTESDNVSQALMHRRQAP
jgi:hypothetical protein